MSQAAVTPAPAVHEKEHLVFGMCAGRGGEGEAVSHGAQRARGETRRRRTTQSLTASPGLPLVAGPEPSRGGGGTPPELQEQRVVRRGLEGAGSRTKDPRGGLVPEPRPPEGG